MFNNIPEVKLGMIAVSRDCFVISISENRRKKIAEECGNIGISIYEAPTVVETERDALKAVEEIKNAGCNALVVFLGNFGPETPETIIAQHFDGPVMFIAAAEERGDNLLNGRGDAYCGMLNCSYNLNLRKIKAYIPAYPVGDARECAIMIKDFIPARPTSEDHSKFTDARCEKINVFQIDDCYSVVFSYVECWELEEFIEQDQGLYHFYYISRIFNQQHIR